MSKLTYIRCGDYDIPNLKLSEQPETSIGKYGRMRKSMREDLKAVERLRKTADQLSRQERDKSHDRGPER
ncbi:TnpV protein [Faecalibacterium sp. I4-3-84]|uniref:TnpV protein n=1 Tax=Faecalibacterium sp. I4-3-84 TaxID=2929495 RepID=UPI003FA60D6A